LLSMTQDIDLVIPRGGKELIQSVVEHSKIPVLKHFIGVCHAYIDKDSDFEMAKNIILNAKTQRPSVCNALETLLLHKALPHEFVADLFGTLLELGVEIRASENLYDKFYKLGINKATPDDFGKEFSDLILAVKDVKNEQEAIDHISIFGSLHTETIVTNNLLIADKFLKEIDSSCVLVNASTRFNDGFELGLGAEIGISTSKIHAFGPMGLKELTTEKFIVIGRGQIRQN